MGENIHVNQHNEISCCREGTIVKEWKANFADMEAGLGSFKLFYSNIYVDRPIYFGIRLP